MIPISVLHVDDETDIREVVAISLGLAPDFATRSCGPGEEALAVAVVKPSSRRPPGLTITPNSGVKEIV
jgi:DNA-binding NtrC family response regulator